VREGRVIELECGCLERTSVGALAGVVEPKPGCPTHGMMRGGSSDELQRSALEAELLARALEIRGRLEQLRNAGGRNPRRVAVALTKLEDFELWLLHVLGRVG
jgi:hypothetical protein